MVSSYNLQEIKLYHSSARGSEANESLRRLNTFFLRMVLSSCDHRKLLPKDRIHKMHIISYDTFTTVILFIRLCIYSNTFLTKNVGVFACSHSVLTDLNFCRVTIRTVQLNHICNLCFVIFVSPPPPPPLAVLYANKSKGRRGSRCRCLNSTTWDTVVFSCRVLYL